MKKIDNGDKPDNKIDKILDWVTQITNKNNM